MTRSELVGFHVAEDVTSREILAVLSAVQAYQKNAYDKVAAENHMAKLARKVNLGLVLHLTIEIKCKPEFAFLFDNGGMLVVDKLKPLKSYDYYRYISLERAREIGYAGKQHLAMAFGNLLGSEGKSLARVDKFVSGTTLPGSVLRFEGEEKLLQDQIKAVSECEAYIGVRGFSSIFASCLKKPVVEFCDEDDRKFAEVTCWSNPYYSVVRNMHDREKGEKHLWRQVTMCRESGTPMGRSMSIASNVPDL